MSVWSQVRSWASWPTDALLVGPETSSAGKWAAWGISFVVGLGLGLASCATTGRGFFTIGSNDNAFSIFVVSVAMLFLPLVCLGFVLPRVGGPLLVVAAAGVVVAALPATHFVGIASALVGALALGAPMALVGVGFTWSGLRPEPKVVQGARW